MPTPNSSAERVAKSRAKRLDLARTLKDLLGAMPPTADTAQCINLVNQLHPRIEVDGPPRAKIVSPAQGAIVYQTDQEVSMRPEEGGRMERRTLQVIRTDSFEIVHTPGVSYPVTSPYYDLTCIDDATVTVRVHKNGGVHWFKDGVSQTGVPRSWAGFAVNARLRHEGMRFRYTTADATHIKLRRDP